MIDVLALGPHPDDVELRVGGTLARFASRGARTGILHLTHGEAATRGDPDTRAQEAAAAAKALGVERHQILDLGDGRLEDGRASRDAVIAVLRTWRPRLLLAPHPFDDHPDHVSAGKIAAAAWYLSGIARIGPAAPPHRPASVWYFPSHRFVMPTFVVQVSQQELDTKMRAVRAYRTQFHDPASTDPETRISAPGFLDGVIARMRTCGEMIGAEYGEGFLVTDPLAVPDPGALLR